MNRLKNQPDLINALLNTSRNVFETNTKKTLHRLEEKQKTLTFIQLMTREYTMQWYYLLDQNSFRRLKKTPERLDTGLSFDY